MKELIKNAWLGWLRYTDHGKFAALLFAVLLYFWLKEKITPVKTIGAERGKNVLGQNDDTGRGLLIYVTVMTIVCVCPVTAAFLMLYQTKFYDYEWIWSLVPMTAVIAWGMADFLAEKWKNFRKEGMGKSLILTICAAALLFLCGGLGVKAWEESGTGEERDRIASVLSAVTENGRRADICLWAPEEVMEYARAYSGGIRLPYGRNMWDKSLNAYSYDTYDAGRMEMYQWMSLAEENGSFDYVVEVSGPSVEEGTEGVGEIAAEAGGEAAAADEDNTQGARKQLSGTLCIQNALAAGVNTVLLPGNMEPEALAAAEEILGVKARQVEGYYLLTILN